MHRISYLQERLTSLSDLFARIFVNILLADVRTPLLHDLFVQNVHLVKLHKDLGHDRDKVRMIYAHETFDASQKGLLMLLRRGELHIHELWFISKNLIAYLHENGRIELDFLQDVFGEELLSKNLQGLVFLV